MAPPFAPGTAPARERRYSTRSPSRRRERRQFEDDDLTRGGEPGLDSEFDPGNGDPELDDGPEFDSDGEGDSEFDSGVDSDSESDLDVDDPEFDSGNGDPDFGDDTRFDLDGGDPEVDSGVDSDPEFEPVPPPIPPPPPPPSSSIPPPPPSPTITPSASPLTTSLPPLEPSAVSAITTYTVYVTSLADGSVDSEVRENIVIPWTDYSGSRTGAVTITPSQATITKPASAASGTVSTVTVSPTSSDIDMEFNHDGHLENMGNGSDTKRHVMIGAASIGTFIGVCILAWLIWRVTRARNKRRRGTDGSPWPRFSRQARVGRVLGRFPWARSHPWAQRWQNLDDEDTMPITREKSASDRSSGLMGRFAPDEKAGARVVPPLDTRNTDRFSQQTGSSDNVSLLSAATSVPSPAVVASHQPQPSFNSLDAQGGTWAYLSAPNSQPQLQHRASNLTSLSSGFGDGDIIIPSAYHPPRSGASTPQPPPSTVTASSAGNALSNRDTIYTATSDDQPARFRTVSSWVNQQKGRIHRAQQRVKDGNWVAGEREGVPPVPGVPAGAGVNGLPAEQEFSLMMPDGEVPRRVDDAGLR